MLNEEQRLRVAHALQRIFDPERPYLHKLYPLYQEYLKDPGHCPKCHSPNVYPEDSFGRLYAFPEDLTELKAMSCALCGWRFEVCFRMEQSEEPRCGAGLDVPGWVLCRVKDCPNTVFTGNNRSELCMCEKHSKRYRNWKRRGRKDRPPFKASTTNDFCLEEVFYGNKKAR